MTKNEMLKQIYLIGESGTFNHETGWSFNKFKKYVEEKLSNSDEILMEIKLPDGWWYMLISKIRNGFYDYYIPDTIEENIKLYDKYSLKL